jgi:hypothetical protein
MKRSAVPLSIFGLALVLACLHVAHFHDDAAALPPVNTVNSESYQVWPILSTGGAHTAFGVTATRDTTTRFSSDSVAVTDSVFIQDARYIALVATVGVSDVADTLLAPLVQVRGPNSPGQWVSGTSFIGGTNNDTPSPPVTAITCNPQTVWYFCPSAAASGAQIPTQGQWYRWRFRNNDLRRYSASGGATFASTGRINLTVRWVRY